MSQESGMTVSQESAKSRYPNKRDYKCKVLSIDGGGIRGLIPAKILAKIEDRTGKPICKLFDMIAGTSTGGILALGLTKPDSDNPKEPEYEARELIEIYREHGPRIFYEPLLERFIDTDDFVRPKYDSIGRDEVITQFFGDTPIQKALAEVFLTSYDIELRKPTFFTSKSEKENIEADNFRKICSGFTMKQAAMATSAAPTYFEPYQIRTSHPTDRGFYSLVDGGVFANNPTALAIMEAIIDGKKAPEPITLNNIFVVSLGTGSMTRKYSYDTAKNWGLVGWVRPLLNITLDGSSESVDCQLEQLLPRATDYPPQYYRFQAFLSPRSESMDATRPEALKELEEIADQIIKEKDEKGELDELCKQLLNEPL
jgi:patatin-like phospholipase/acyl hydrolase